MSAQAQYGPGSDYGYRPREERRIIERLVERPYYGWRSYERDCRVKITRRINRFGERVITRRRVCD